MNIFVKLPTKTIQFDVKPTASIPSVKARIQAQEGIDVEKMTLKYAGIVLTSN
jgi:hypothetical protein